MGGETGGGWETVGRGDWARGLGEGWARGGRGGGICIVGFVRSGVLGCEVWRFPGLTEVGGEGVGFG